MELLPASARQAPGKVGGEEDGRLRRPARPTVRRRARGPVGRAVRRDSSLRARYRIWSRFRPSSSAARVWFQPVRSSACTTMSRSTSSRRTPPGGSTNRADAPPRGACSGKCSAVRRSPSQSRTFAEANTVPPGYELRFTTRGAPLRRIRARYRPKCTLTIPQGSRAARSVPRHSRQPQARDERGAAESAAVDAGAIHRASGTSADYPLPHCERATLFSGESALYRTTARGMCLASTRAVSSKHAG